MQRLDPASIVAGAAYSMNALRKAAHEENVVLVVTAAEADMIVTLWPHIQVRAGTALSVPIPTTDALQEPLW